MVKQIFHKPDLVDPYIERKVIRTLNPPKEDYWAPTKSSAKTFYASYIKPNMTVLIFFCIFLALLYYRYRMVKKNREASEMETFYGPHHIPNPNLYQTHKPIQPPIHSKSKPSPAERKAIADLMDFHARQADNMREPIFKGNANEKPEPGPFVYPIYPSGNGGSLVPSRLGR